MALHRNIHWIGRQWAVTGHGMQLINQKLSGQFDIGIDRLWDDGLDDVLRAQKWFNADDFSTALSIARARYPEPPRKTLPPLPVEKLLKASGTIAPSPKSPEMKTPEIAKAEPVDAPRKAPSVHQLQVFQMRFPGRARFVHPWKVRTR